MPQFFIYHKIKEVKIKEIVSWNKTSSSSDPPSFAVRNLVWPRLSWGVDICALCPWAQIVGMLSPFFCDPFKFCILSVKKRQWNYQRPVQKRTIPNEMLNVGNDKDDLDCPSQATVCVCVQRIWRPQEPLVCVQRISCPQEPQISPVKTSAKHITRRNNENGLQNDR